MEKKMYEEFKQLKTKIKNGTANFKERNIWNIIKKQKKKGRKIYFKNNI